MNQSGKTKYLKHFIETTPDTTIIIATQYVQKQKDILSSMIF